MHAFARREKEKYLTRSNGYPCLFKFSKAKKQREKKFKPEAFGSPVVDEPWLVLHHSLSVVLAYLGIAPVLSKEPATKQNKKQVHRKE